MNPGQQYWRRLGAEVGPLPLLLVAVTAATVLDALRRLQVLHPDYLIARVAGRGLLSEDGLLVYRQHARAQMGPASLLLALVPRPVYVIAVAALVGPCLYWLAVAAGWDRPGWRDPALPVAALGAAAVVVPWAQLAWKGHADDAMVLTGAAMLAQSMARQTLWARFGGLALALAGKPTALALVPLLAGAQVDLVFALLLVAVIWGPFFIASPAGLLHAGRGVMKVGSGSLVAYLGLRVGAPSPGWVRGWQTALGLVSAGLGALRGRPLQGLLLAFTVRALIDPNPAPAYSIPLVVLAWAVDLGNRRPVSLVLAVLSFWLSGPVLAGGTGGYRLAALAALAAVCLYHLYGRALLPLPALRGGNLASR